MSKLVKINGVEVSVKKACEKLGVKYSTVYQRMKFKGISFEEAIKGLVELKEEKEIQTKTKKVMILNDIHVPYQLDDLCNKIKSVYNGEVDEIIIGGDLIDCESLSSFGKKYRISLKKEIGETVELLENLKETFNPKKIYYVGGNHDKDRYERVVEKMQEKDLYCLLPESLIEEVSELVEGVIPVDHWYGRFYNNLIVCHPKSFSNIPARTSEQCAEYFVNRGIASNTDVIVLGHTHKYSQIVATRRSNLMVVENGCLCKPMDYADTGKLSYGEQVNCFTVIELEEDKPIDKNKIKTYFL